MMKFMFTSDPAHGYLRVPLALLKKYGVMNKISPYSFKNGKYAYLEEDLDCNTFLNSVKSCGDSFVIVSRITVGPATCRKYDSFPMTSEYMKFRKDTYRFRDCK